MQLSPVAEQLTNAVRCLHVVHSDVLLASSLRSQDTIIRIVTSQSKKHLALRLEVV
jgi:hypothetical protein